MKFSVDKFSILCFVLTCFTFVQGKGGSGGGSGGGGRGGGGGGRSGGGISGIGGYGRGNSAKGLTRARAAVILGSGAAGYAAYKAHKNLKKDRERGDKDRDDLDSDSFEQYFTDQEYADYKLQEATSYYASEGLGMSAWTLIALILGIIALGTVGWYCCNVFLPVWQDNRQMRRRSNLGVGRMKDEMPLQETPSTATPSP